MLAKASLTAPLCSLHTSWKYIFSVSATAAYQGFRRLQRDIHSRVYRRIHRQSSWVWSLWLLQECLQPFRWNHRYYQLNRHIQR